MTPLEHILFGKKITSKLEKIHTYHETHLLRPENPAREESLKIGKSKFPQAQELSTLEGRVKALHSFASHELQAIELMSLALLFFPAREDWEKKYKDHLLLALDDEQRHFKLYEMRIKDLGYNFGDFPVNLHLWNKCKNITTLKQFAAVMSLTFETANLDFALHYALYFRKFGDEKSAHVLEEVHQDEIVHVAYGQKAFDASLEHENNFFKAYEKELPFGLTPAHSRGGKEIFDLKGRKKARLTDDFIKQTRTYPRAMRAKSSS